MMTAKTAARLVSFASMIALGFCSTAIGAETVLTRVGFGPYPPLYASVYNVAEVDVLMAQTKDADGKIRTELRTEMQEIQRSVLERVTNALHGLPASVFSEEAKRELAADIAESISLQTKQELERMKVELKQEILQAVADKLVSGK